MVGPSSLLESCGSVLGELLLPAIEHRRLAPQFVTQIRDRHSFRQMPPQDGDLLFRGVVLPLASSCARSVSATERPLKSALLARITFPVELTEFAGGISERCKHTETHIPAVPRFQFKIGTPA
jgi:hypothetical protein